MNYIVYMKSSTQILRERAAFEASAKRKGRLPFDVCPTYIKNERGKMIDTWALSPEQIAQFVVGQQDQKHDLDIMHCLNLGKHRCAHPDQKISTFTQLKNLLALADQVDDPQVVMDVITTLDTSGLLETTRTFVNALSKSGYPEITTDDIINHLAEHDKQNPGMERV